MAEAVQQGQTRNYEVMLQDLPGSQRAVLSIDQEKEQKGGTLTRAHCDASGLLGQLWVRFDYEAVRVSLSRRLDEVEVLECNLQSGRYSAVDSGVCALAMCGSAGCGWVVPGGFQGWAAVQAVVGMYTVPRHVPRAVPGSWGAERGDSAWHR